MRSSLIIFIQILLLTSCTWFSNESNVEEKPLVKVDESYLYPSSLKGVGAGLSESDSIQNVEKYIEQWIRNEIVLNEAKKDSLIDKDFIEQKLQNLRRDLYLYEYEKNLLKANLSKEVTNEDIQLFYEENPENFELKQNIFRGYFIKIDRSSKSISKVKGYLKKPTDENLELLNKLVQNEAESYHIDTTIWHNFNDIMRNTPLEKVTNQKKYLSGTKLDIRYDKKFTYFIKVLSYKLVSEVAPIEFHEKMIRNTLIHKRRKKMIEDNEETLYNNAKQENRFEKYF